MKLGLERRGFFIVVMSDKEMDLNEECSLRDSWILVLNSFFLRCCFDGDLLIMLLFVRWIHVVRDHHHRLVRQHSN